MIDIKNPTLTLDIRFLGIFEALKTITLTSSEHFSLYPEGKISWIVKNSEVIDLCGPFKLNNVDFVLAN